ncbi:MAG: ABC transporter permease [Acidimicrobiia bacterium]
MTNLAGTATLVRLILRRDRIRLPVWLASLGGVAAMSAAATVPLYPTVESRVVAAEALNSQASLVALYGRIYDPTSVGSLALVKLGGFGAVMVALLAIFTVVRHTRAEEEAGRLELVRSTTVGRHASLTAALLVAAATDVVLAVVTAVALVAAGLPVEGSIAFGSAWAGVGIAFAAIAGIAVQLPRSARAATGIATATLGAVYLLRAVGDAGSETGTGWLTWLSPIGWGQQFRPYAGNRWWVLLITLGFAAAASTGAYLLASRRDTGAGLLADRPGRARAKPSLRGPLALAWRLQRSTFLAWAVAFVVLGLVFGNLASSVGSFLSSPQALLWMAKLGGQKGLVDMFLAAELSFVGVFASAYGIQAASRLHSEESTGLAAPVLATATSRSAWAAGHTAIALAGTTVLMVLAGLSAGLAHGVQSHDMGEVGRVLAGALVQLPAVWILTGLVVAAFGMAPRTVSLGWVALAVFIFLGEFGALLELPQWAIELSPFAHVPKLPGAPVHVTPLALLSAASVLLVAAGLTGFRRRDLA